MKKKLLFIMLLVYPSIVLASSGSDEFPILVAIGMEAFVSIHMSLFVLVPLSNIFSKDGNQKKLFWTLFFICYIFYIIMSIIIITF